MSKSKTTGKGLRRKMNAEPTAEEITSFRNKQMFIMVERLETLSDLEGIQYE